MSTDQPTPGSPDDPFAKRPQDGGPGAPPNQPPNQPPDEPNQPPDEPNEPPSKEPPPGQPYGGPYGAPPPGGAGGGGPYGPGEGGPYGEGPHGAGPYGADTDPLAGMPPLAAGGKRVLARIIDIILVLIPAFLLDWAAVGLQDSDFSAGRSAVGGVFTAGIGFVYEFLMTRDNGRTVGKRLLGMRAAMLQDGSIPTASAAAVRAAVLWLPAFCCSCAWFLVIGLTVAFDKPYKQGLHDKAASTVVVEVA
jgi:uncharacterized RDD family membrane protein YckC